MLISELEELESVLDEIKVNNTITEEDTISLFETLGLLIDTYVMNHIKNISEPEFHNDLYSCILNILDLQLSEIFSNSFEYELEEVINISINNYFRSSYTNFYPVIIFTNITVYRFQTIMAIMTTTSFNFNF